MLKYITKTAVFFGKQRFLFISPLISPCFYKRNSSGFLFPAWYNQEKRKEIKNERAKIFYEKKKRG